MYALQQGVCRAGMLASGHYASVLFALKLLCDCSELIIPASVAAEAFVHAQGTCTSGQ